MRGGGRRARSPCALCALSTPAALHPRRSAWLYLPNPRCFFVFLSGPQDEQRLELLKEIGGTRVYEERRRESVRVMEECQSKRAHIQDLVRGRAACVAEGLAWAGWRALHTECHGLRWRAGGVGAWAGACASAPSRTPAPFSPPPRLQPTPALKPACNPPQIGQLDEKLGELEAERAELAQFQRADRRRRCLEYTIYDKELTKVKQDAEKVRVGGVAGRRWLHDAEEGRAGGRGPGWSGDHAACPGSAGGGGPGLLLLSLSLAPSCGPHTPHRVPT